MENNKEIDMKKENELIKNSIDSTISAVEKNLSNVQALIDARTEHTVKLPATVLNNLDPEELNISARNISLDNGNLFTFTNLKADGLTGDPLQNALGSDITNAAVTLNAFMPNGNHAFIRMVDQNIYLAENFPALEESLQLFIDSCVNGSYTGDPLKSTKTPFRFYDKSGAEIKDEAEIARYTELLIPTRSTSVYAESFFDIEINIRKKERRDGMCLVRYIEFKKVLKELYIKYLLKKTKVKEMIKKEKVVKVAKVPEIAPLPAKGNKKVALESIDKNHYYTLDELHKFGYSDGQINGFESDYRQTDTIKSISKENAAFTKEILMYANESFEEFVERYNSGFTEPLHDIEEETRRGMNKKCIYPKILSVDAGRYSDDINSAMISEMKKAARNIDRISSFGTESADSSFKGLESLLAKDNILEHITLGDIYNTTFPDNFNINEETYGFESDGSEPYIEPYFVNPIHKLFYNTSRYIDIDFSQYGAEDVTFPNAELNMYESTFLLNHRNGAPTPPKSQVISKDEVNNNSIAKQNKIETPDGEQKQIKIPHGRIEKLFASVKGGVVEILDSQRLVPVLPGKRLLGAFYITHSHELMRNLILTRQFMSQPAAFMNLTDSEYEFAGSQEDLVARMLFADKLKPIIEKNMSTKFLRENAEVMYTISKIMEDQELSNSINYSDIANYNLVNLSRITFIPASELHVARNTDNGFGESFYQKARVPANFRIIANEAYLAWVVHDGKPINLIRVQAGLGDGGGIYGTNNALRQLQAHKMTRGGLRRINGRGQNISAETVVYQSQGTEDLISYMQIPGYDLRIEKDMMRQWENEATSIVGFNSALFTSEDGRIELARKLADLDEIQTNKILHEQRRQARPASDRATRLLHLRGGDDVKDVIVEYIPPYLTRDNNVKQSEVLKEVAETIEAIKNIYEAKYEDNNDYQEVKEYVMEEVINRMNISDVLVTASDDILKEAKRKKEAIDSINMKETK